MRTLVLSVALLLCPVVVPPDDVRVEIAGKAVQAPDGSVSLKLRTRCPAGAEVLEALAYITQDGSTSQFAGVPMTCDGRPHRVDIVVRAFEETPFHSGAANATTYALVSLGSEGQTASGGDTEEIWIRPFRSG